jgi:hypothetical protein
MASNKSKFAGLSELRNQQQGTEPPAKRAGEGGLNLPARKPTGKRSNPEWKQRAVLLKIASCEEAETRLRKDHQGTDFSDLMQALLQQWLDNPS